MSIVVTSNAPAAQAEKPAGESVETKSALVADKAAEQTEVSDTDTEKNEAVEQDADNDDSEADGDELEAKDDSEKAKPKAKSGSQRRKERAERAEAEVARLQRLVEGMALKGAGSPDKPEPKEAAATQANQVNDDGRPRPEDFETHLEFMEKLTDWKLDQREQAKKADDHKAKLKADQQALEKAHFAREKAFAEKTADYAEVLKDVDHFKGASPTLAEIIGTSEIGPELMYELAKNPEEYERINALPPIAAAREMGKIESRIASLSSDAQKPEPKKQTKAPPPIAPVSSKGGSVAKSIHEIAASGSQAEYEAARLKQLAARKSAW